MTGSGRFLLHLLVLVGGLAALPATSHGDIYRYVDARGVVHFTNTPTDSNYALYLREKSAGGNLAEVIRRHANRFRIDEALVRAVIKVESDFNPRALSSKGAQGMMQLIPETARDMNVADPFDPEQNIRGGTRYLRLMLDRFDGDLELALAAYNAGPTTVQRHGGIPPYRETLDYVDRVKRYLDYYRRGADVSL